MVISSDGLELDVVFSRYHSGNIAISLFTKDQEPWATVTANFKGLDKSEVAIRNYSENEGMYKDLLAAGIVKPAHRIIQSGFEEFPVCELTPEAMAEASLA